MSERNLKLIKPCSDFLQEYYQLCKESYADLKYAYIMHDPAQYDKWSQTIFEDYENSEKGINLPEGFIPSKTYWIVSGDKIVGIANIRLGLTDALRHFGGHLGIFIRESARRHGYALEALKQMLQESQKLGIMPVLVTVERDNEPSFNMVNKLPYKSRTFEDIIFEGRETTACRYWFE